jgi:hypothetical protein
MTMNTNTYETNTRISQMKLKPWLKPSFFLHCITNRGLPFPANVVDGQIQGHQPACDGHYSRHSVCSNWPDAVVLEVERQELGLLVALDGLADCA